MICISKIKLNHTGFITFRTENCRHVLVKMYRALYRMEVKSRYYYQYVNNPQLHILPVTSTDFLHKIHLQFTRYNIRISAFCHWQIFHLIQNQLMYYLWSDSY